MKTFVLKIRAAVTRFFTQLRQEARDFVGLFGDIFKLGRPR